MKICLVVPYRNNEIEELERALDGNAADLYIFPEGFLHNDTLNDAMAIIREKNKFVITGYKMNDESGNYEQALVIEKGSIIGKYTKCVLTDGEKQKGKVGGTEIHCVNTSYGKIAIPICYEIHFPEVARIMEYENPVLLVNLIGTGMYNKEQFEQWTTICKARAIENEVCVVGCSHFYEGIPLAFAYTPKGEVIREIKNVHGGMVVDIDLSESKRKQIGYFDDRRPELFGKISCKKP